VVPDRFLKIFFMPPEIVMSATAAHTPATISLFARPALGFAGSTLLAVALMLLISMIA